MRKQTKTIGVVSPTRRECRARTNKRETVWKWRHTRIVMKYRSIGWNKRGRATADDEQDVYILHCAFYSFETSPEGVAKSCGPPTIFFFLFQSFARKRATTGRSRKRIVRSILQARLIFHSPSLSLPIWRF